MSSFYQTVISIISKPSEKRNDDEINFILNWFINLFKKKQAVFGDVTAEVIKDIIKNCSFETKNSDDIIIKQGDFGDCFYINLRGKVSIYINHNNETDHFDESNIMENNNDDATKSTTPGKVENLNELIEALTMTNEMKSKKLREKLGNYVTSLGVGEGFGEYALINSESRSASIVADEITDLMVVNKQLYARCLQASSLRKLTEKQKFINNSVFFGNWSPKMKKLLSLCLERDIVPYDSCLGKQGEPLDKIYFIISGQAKVSVNPMMHKVQYPKLYPLKLAENQEQDLINSWIEEKNYLLNTNSSKNQIKLSTINQNNNNNVKTIVIKRRNETFAEAEQRLKIKNIEVGILGPGEIVGMCEGIFNMNSYIQTTKCIEDCDVYYIYKRSYDRLIAKRNPNCIKKMRDNVYTKLKARNQRLNKSSTPVDLFRSIQYRIELTKNKKSHLIQDDAEIIHNGDENLSELTNEKSYKSAPRGSIVQIDFKKKSAAYLRLKKILDARKRKQFETERKMIGLNILTQNSDDNKEESTEKINLEFNNEDETNNRNDETKFANTIDDNLLMSDDPNNKALISLEDRIKQFHLNLGCKKVSVTKLNRIDINKIKTEIKTGENVLVKRYNNFKSNSSNSRNSNEINISDDECNTIPALTYSRPVTNGGEGFNGDAFNSNRNSNPDLKQLTQSDYNIIINIIPPLNFNNDNISSKDITIWENNEIIYCNNDDKSISKCRLSSNNYNQTIDTLYLNETTNNEQINKMVSINTSGNAAKLTSSSQIEPLKEEMITNNINSNKEETPRRVKKNSMPNLMYNHRRQSNSSNNNDPFSSYVIGRKFSLGQIKIQRTGKVYSKEEYIALKDLLKKQTKRFNVNPINI